MAISSAVQILCSPIISRVLEEVLVDHAKTFQVRLWNGTAWGTAINPRFTLVLNNLEAFRRLFVYPSELSIGEAYIRGDFDVEGDLEAAFEFGDYLLNRKASPGVSRTLLTLLEKMPSQEGPTNGSSGPKLVGAVHSKERDLQAIRYHYDLPPDFFALWLDRHMVYSSAYFANGDDADLDAAQEYKLEYICRKLRLRRGDHLLDVGCGWGGLIAYAAAHYGVYAHGVTLSLRQAEIARKRIHDAGLDDHCLVEVCDYRDIECAQQFDRIISIGMFEHVGEKLLPEYFGRMWRLLRAGGGFLNSGIACAFLHRRSAPSFVESYVFPDGELVPLSTSLGAAEAVGFEVRDVESLREHYAMTLRQWVRRLEACADQARDLTDETTYRIWRLYMAGSEHQFRTGELNLYQVLLAKPERGNSGMPLTRDDWYDKGSTILVDSRASTYLNDSDIRKRGSDHH
jgi:cyclopropane-fatty-acyl-phospholipid synthase